MRDRATAIGLAFTDRSFSLFAVCCRTVEVQVISLVERVW